MPILHFIPKVERNGNVTVITFTGRRNRGVGNALASELEGRSDGLYECHLLLDFVNMEFITGVDLGTLITLHKKTRASGKQLILFNLNAEIYEVFSITKLDTLFEILREEANQLVPTHVICDNMTELLRKLDDHDENESDLFHEAFERDVGGEG